MRPLPLNFFILSLVLLMACKQNGQQVEDSSVDAPSVDSASTGLSHWIVGSHPESVSIAGASVYVSQFGKALQPMNQDGDGYIAEYDANGTFVDTLYSGLDAPKGTLVVGELLYVADIDTLFAINMASGELVSTYSFVGESSFLNGLAADNESNIYVSGTDVGKIWKLEPSTGKVSFVTAVEGANGLAYNSKSDKLYCASYLSDNPEAGFVSEIDMATGKVAVLGDYRGLLDGCFLFDDMLYVTDWNPLGEGRLVKIDLASGASEVLVEDSMFAGPANFDVMSDGTALVPMLMDRHVAIIRL